MNKGLAIPLFKSGTPRQTRDTTPLSAQIAVHQATLQARAQSRYRAHTGMHAYEPRSPAHSLTSRYAATAGFSVASYSLSSAGRRHGRVLGRMRRHRRVLCMHGGGGVGVGGRWGQPLCVLTTGGLLEACQVGQDEVPGGAGQGVFPKAGVDEVGDRKSVV